MKIEATNTTCTDELLSGAAKLSIFFLGFCRYLAFYLFSFKYMSKFPFHSKKQSLREVEGWHTLWSVGVGLITVNVTLKYSEDSIVMQEFYTPTVS